jgi:predicted dinucleotide-binding enzyme
MTVAVLGTGQMGAALARRLTLAGVPVVIGSRDPARADALAARIGEAARAPVKGATHVGAIAACEVVVLAIPFEDAATLVREVLTCLPGRIVVDPTTPWGEHVPPTSGAATIAALLPANVPLVAAWKTTFAGELSVPFSAETHDVFVCGDDAAAKRTVAAPVATTRAPDSSSERKSTSSMSSVIWSISARACSTSAGTSSPGSVVVSRMVSNRASGVRSSCDTAAVKPARSSS